MRDIRGDRVPLNKKAEAIAEYLHEKQWQPKQADNKIPLSRAKEKVFGHNLKMDTGAIKMGEVLQGQQRLKGWKAPGPDGNVAELYIWLQGEALGCLVEALNENWNRKQLAKYKNAANIASLYKK